jgi:hypothetical protein
MQEQNYSINDKSPVAGVNYYRLRMVDIDGKFSYSNITAVKINVVGKLQLYSNPVTDILMMNINASMPGTTMVYVYDVQGRLLKTKTMIFRNAGNNILEWDISQLAKGIYFLKVEELSLTLRFVKN